MGVGVLNTEHLEELQIHNLLMQTGDELTDLLRGLNGEYIPQHLVVICCGMALVSYLRVGISMP